MFQLPAGLSERIEQRRKHVRSLKAQADIQRSTAERVADAIVAVFGSIPFMLFHVVWFALWILINVDWFPAIPAFDPFPFGLLTMIVSLEAIFLSVFVLISQNRSQKIADLREEINLLVSTQSEHEITETLKIVDQIAKHLKVKLTTAEKKQVKKFEADLDEGRLKAQIEKEI